MYRPVRPLAGHVAVPRGQARALAVAARVARDAQLVVGHLAGVDGGRHEVGRRVAVGVRRGEVRARPDQVLQDVCAGRGALAHPMNGVRAVGVRGVDGGAGPEQRAHDPRAVGRDRHVQRQGGGRHVRAGAVRQEHARHVDVALLARDQERRDMAVASPVDLGAGGEQHVRRLDVAALARGVQGAAAAAGQAVDLGAGREQGAQQLGLPDRDVRRQPPVAVRYVGPGAVGQEQLHQF